jgi:hypothetical protein
MEAAAGCLKAGLHRHRSFQASFRVHPSVRIYVTRFFLFRKEERGRMLFLLTAYFFSNNPHIDGNNPTIAMIENITIAGIKPLPICLEI